MTNKPRNQQAHPNHATRGGQGKTSDSTAAMAKFLESESEARKPDSSKESSKGKGSA